MKKNIHDYERVGRVLGGLALSSLAFWGPRNPWMLGFLIPVGTGLVGTCPIYSAIGISTRKAEEKPEDYFPQKSSSEQGADHPIADVS